MSGTDQVEQLERKVEHTRAELAHTVDELNRRAEEKMHKAAEVVPFVLGGLALLLAVMLLRRIRRR